MPYRNREIGEWGMSTYLEDEYRKAVSGLVSWLKSKIRSFSCDMTDDQLKELKATIDEEIEKRRRVIE